MSALESGDDLSTEMVSLEVKPAKWHEVDDESHEKVTVAPIKRSEESATKCISHPLLLGNKRGRNWDQGVTYFNDGVRPVDFVLVYDSNYSTSNDLPSSGKRATYEANLSGEGLQLEQDDDEKSGLRFTKIHVPQDVMIRYAEILKFRQPIRRELCANFPCDDNKSIIKKHMVFDEGPILKQEHQEEAQKSRAKKYLDLLGHHKNRVKGFLHRHIYVDNTYFPPVGFRFSTTFSSDKMYLFDLSEENFFSPTSRSRVAHFILSRIQFEETTELDPHAFGIDRLINMGAYHAAYPLHDGDYNTQGTMRNALLTEWGTLRRWYRYQPLDYIKDYFGVKVALYFCWLGFYTCMLFPAAIVGIIVFLSGFLHVDSSALSSEVCAAHDVVMCPLCDKFCTLWNLDSSCTYSTILSFFDNGGTAFFAAFMSIWAVLFLELWKRYAAEVTHRWDLTGYDLHEEVPRPQYLAKLDRYHKAKMRLNKVTGAEEKRLPFWTVKLPITFFSFSVVFLLVFLALVAAIGVIVYRMAMITASALYGVETLGKYSSHALVLINITAGVINLVTLMMLTWLYDWVAKSLTEFEMNRTQSEFDDSLTFKMYLLQFINYYTSIFYLAFIKGKYTGYPGDYSRILGIRQEECDTGGCLFEVTAQLAIVMVGKQAFGTIIELFTPIIMKYWRRGFAKMFQKRDSNSKQWVKDYYLEEVDIFSEYLEMVLQYGFVTIFVSAFPLAPLCALINNLFESRCDARKLLIYYRRPVAVRVKGIGVWLTILDFVSKFAVFSNALIIAFTSEFIPHLVYRLTESPDYSLKGYMNYSLSYMNISELDRLDKGINIDSNVTYCRYKDHRYPPWEENRYQHTTTYWTVLAARLIFMVLFENIVIFLVLVIAWAIPDVPVKLKEKIRRETYIINNIIIEQARNTNKRQDSSKKTRNVPSSLPPTVRHESDVYQKKSPKPKKPPINHSPPRSLPTTPKHESGVNQIKFPESKKLTLDRLPNTDEQFQSLLSLAELPHAQDITKNKKKKVFRSHSPNVDQGSGQHNPEAVPKNTKKAEPPDSHNVGRISDSDHSSDVPTNSDPPKKKKKKKKKKQKVDRPSKPDTSQNLDVTPLTHEDTSKKNPKKVTRPLSTDAAQKYDASRDHGSQSAQRPSISEEPPKKKQQKAKNVRENSPSQGEFPGKTKAATAEPPLPEPPPKHKK